MDRAKNGCDTYFRERKAIDAAAENLTDEQRRNVINQVNPDHVLSMRQLKRLHFAPLGRRLDDVWCDLALVALDANKTPSEIASSVFVADSTFRWGTIAAREAERIRIWEGIGSHKDSRIREVARIGKESARRDYEFWQKREKDDEFNDYFE
jgi:hypothetical protein